MLRLYGHPFSSYCQKALIALYEHGLPFEFRVLGGDEAVQREFAQLWPMRKMPVLVDGDRTIVEASIIVEHLDLKHARTARLLPEDARAALEVRTLDRCFDNYLMTPMQKIVADFIRSAEVRDPHGVREARDLIERTYRWLDGSLAGRTWAAGDSFTLADCAAAPALFYADWVHPIDPSLGTVRAYRQRLLARPSFARAVDEARPFRSLFPPGSPDRD